MDFWDKNETKREVAPSSINSTIFSFLHPFSTLNPISYISFSFLSPFLATCTSGEISENSLPLLPKRSRADNIDRIFNKHWSKEMERRKKGKKPRLYVALVKSFGFWWLLSLMLVLTTSFSIFVGPTLIPFFIDFVMDPTQPTYIGFIYVGILIVSGIFFGMANYHSFKISVDVATRMRSALIQAVYRKSFALSPVSRQKENTGKIVNLISNDSQRVMDMVIFGAMGLVAPIQFAIGIGMLIWELHFIVIIPASIFILFMILIFMAFFVMMTVRKKVMFYSDKRVKVINELLQDVKAVKFYAWEKNIIKKIKQIRAIELSLMFVVSLCRLVVIFSMSMLPSATTVITFVIYVLLGNDLTPQRAFKVLSIFGYIRVPLMFVPLLIGIISQLTISLKRLGGYLSLPESDEMDDIVRDYVGEERRKLLLSELNEKDGEEATLDKKEGESLEMTSIDVSDSDKEDASDKESHSSAKVAEEGLKEELDEEYDPGQEFDEQDPDIKLSIRGGEFIWCSIPEKTSMMAKIMGVPMKKLMGFFMKKKMKKMEKEIQKKKERMGDFYKPLESSAGGDSMPGGGHGMSGGGHGAHGGAMPPSDASADGLKSPTQAPPVQTFEATLKKINFFVRTGELVMIVGQTGSGKSSLISALLGTIPRLDGEVKLDDSLSYAAQIPWLFNASIRQNILIGKEFEESRYQEAVNAACLGPDFKLLPGGDMTEIGEKGITLSGGQKQRVSLARVFYHDADVYVLDDPFSAVDSHIGRTILEKGIRGILQHKTVVIVLNQLHFLPYADRIYRIAGHTIAETGTFDELMARENGGTRSLVDEFGSVEKSKEENESTEVEKGAEIEKGNTKSKEVTMEKEERAVGAVSPKVYWFYLHSSSAILFAMMMVILVLVAVGQLLTDYWLSFWSSDSLNQSHFFYIGIYALIAVISWVLFFSNSASWILFGLIASRSVHQKLLKRLVYAPMTFFERTPSGRILNRFSKDVDQLDMILPGVWFGFFSAFISTLGILIGISVGTLFITFILIFPVFLIYFYLLQYFRHGARQFQRLESITRSPIFANFSEALNGITTITTFGLRDKFFDINRKLVDVNVQLYRYVLYGMCWQGIRLDVLGYCLAGVTTTFIIIFRDLMSPGNAGLVISYSLVFTLLLSHLSRSFTQLEVSMNSIERLRHYSVEVEQEPPHYIKGKKKFKISRGEVVFRDVHFSYRSNLPEVLCGVSFNAAAKEKIGIVGRTGAGKSSLMVTLYRLREISSGQILIDGEDISKLGLNALRRNIGIIPQDPVMFSGTVRSNIDPFNDFSEDEMWHALDLVKMKDLIERQPLLLETEVLERGANFSSGQKQLICLARTLLRRPKLLILDEATSSVDTKTDALVQKVIRSEFSESTILTIAHRLNTIMDSDRIIVMEKGHIAEIDTPLALLNNPDSLFSFLCQNTGESSMEHYRRVASGIQTVYEVSTETSPAPESVDPIEIEQVPIPIGEVEEKIVKISERKSDDSSTDESSGEEESGSDVQIGSSSGDESDE